MKMKTITATKAAGGKRFAPFGTKVIKVKAGDTIVADADNADAWIDAKLFTEGSGKSAPKNSEPKTDNTGDATKKAEADKAKGKK